MNEIYYYTMKSGKVQFDLLFFPEKRGGLRRAFPEESGV